MDNAQPLPEILDGEDWEVRNSGDIHVGYVDFDKREFVVPFTNSEAGELVRAHEAMHVKISPRNITMKKSQFVTLQSLEDCRVHQGLRLSGIPTDTAPVWQDHEIEKVLQDHPDARHPQRLGEMLFALHKTASQAKVEELTRLYEPTGKVIEKANELIEKYFDSKERRGELSTWQDVEMACQEWHEEIKEMFPNLPGPNPGTGAGGKANDDSHGDKKKGDAQNITEGWEPGTGDGDMSQDIGDMTEEELREAMKYIPQGAERRSFRYRDYFSKFGDLKPIQHPRLTHKMRFKTTLSVKQNASDEGVIPVAMARYATDMKLFKRSGKRRAGAAVLIDVSGSMSLTENEVLEIIKQCPAAIVACYSGYRDDGILRIIAEDGKYSPELNKGMPGENIVDGPALEWLAKRKEKKKLWISDGWVTTKGAGMLDPVDLRKLTVLLKSKKIERVGNVRALLKSGKLIDRAFDDGHTIGRSYAEKA